MCVSERGGGWKKKRGALGQDEGEKHLAPFGGQIKSGSINYGALS